MDTTQIDQTAALIFLFTTAHMATKFAKETLITFVVELLLNAFWTQIADATLPRFANFMIYGEVDDELVSFFTLKTEEPLLTLPEKPEATKQETQKHIAKSLFFPTTVAFRNPQNTTFQLFPENSDSDTDSDDEPSETPQWIFDAAQWTHIPKKASKPQPKPLAIKPKLLKGNSFSILDHEECVDHEESSTEPSLADEADCQKTKPAPQDYTGLFSSDLLDNSNLFA